MSRAAGLLDALEDDVCRELERWGVPGLTLGVLAGGGSDVRGYGVASLETGVPVLPDTLFRIASITKPITSTLALSLVEEGLLELDRPVADALPELPIADRTLCLRHLLSHSSGLDGEPPGDTARYGAGDDALERLVADLGGLRRWAAPGRVWAYCNAGYWLAGAMIARALGVPFETALRERVLEPLAMRRTFASARDAIVHPSAAGHVVRSGGEGHRVAPAHGYPRARVPSGGVISCVPDLLAFAAFHLGNGGVPSLMREPQIDAVGVRWGLGWQLETVAGELLASHAGSYGGFQTQLQLVPARGFAVAALSNSARGSAALRPLCDRALELGCGLYRPETRPVEPAAGELARLAGLYRQRDLALAVTEAAGGLRVEARMRDVATGRFEELPAVTGVPVGARAFLVVGGEARGSRFDFLELDAGGPLLARFGGRLSEREE